MDNGASSYLHFLQGDDSALSELVRDYKDGLILFLNRYVNNIHTAEDLAEDTFFKLITQKPHYTQRCSFKTWLYTIGRNMAVDYLRLNERIEAMDEEEMNRLGADMENLERSYLQKTQTITVHRALGSLHPDYAQVLHLKYFEDLSNDQIAVVMRKSRRQIVNLLYHAKLSLKEHLDKEGFEYEGLS